MTGDVRQLAYADHGHFIPERRYILRIRHTSPLRSMCERRVEFTVGSWPFAGIFLQALQDQIFDAELRSLKQTANLLRPLENVHQRYLI